MFYLNTYILVDAARVEHLIGHAKNLNPRFDSLYRGGSDEELGDVAPYLFTLLGNNEFSSWLYERGWGNSWGSIVVSKINFEDCWKHFRKFLLIKTEDGEELYFRFYDTRVLKIFLPTCDKQQILEFFGPVDSFIVEGDTKEQAIRFWHQNGELKQEIIPVEEVFGQVITNDINS